MCVAAACATRERERRMAQPPVDGPQVPDGLLPDEAGGPVDSSSRDPRQDRLHGKAADGCCAVGLQGTYPKQPPFTAAVPGTWRSNSGARLRTAPSTLQQHNDDSQRTAQPIPTITTTTLTTTTATKEQLALLATLDSGPDQPLAMRVGLLGPDLYWQWAHRPVPGRPRFFASHALEACTKTPWWVVPLLWLPLFLGCFLRAHLALHVPLVALPAWVALGVLCWQLLEYAIHRWAFHARPTSYWGITLHFLLHGNHHKFPQDPLRLVFPPLPASLLVLAVWEALAALLPPHHAVPLFASMGVGYVAYDCMHYAMHHAMGPGGRSGTSTSQGGSCDGGQGVEEMSSQAVAQRTRGRGLGREDRHQYVPSVAQRTLRWVLRSVWRSHMAHHYRDPVRRGSGNYGISGALFDRMLGTSL